MNERSWLQHFIWLYDYQSPKTILNYFLLAASVPTVFWSYLEIVGTEGSTDLFIKLVILGMTFALLVALITYFLKWWLLFHALKGYIKKYLLRKLTEEKILLGIGPGGAIAVGMVAKAIRVLNYEPPSVIVIDHRYEFRGEDPSIGKLLSLDKSIPKERYWIIQGHIGTGNSLRVFKNKFDLEEVPVFAFVVSPEANIRENFYATLAIGTRAVLPWPTEKAPSR